MITVTLSPDSERAPLWKELYGTLTLPVVSAIPETLDLPILGRREVLLLDARALPAEVLDRVAAACAACIARVGAHVTPEAARETLLKKALPLLVREDLCVNVPESELPAVLAEAEARGARLRFSTGPLLGASSERGSA